jgi:NAD(P)-dependent dehydrogenase (short-subunit alcohol dehydrogenase family)
MTDSSLALVVGANRGIGLGVVTELLARGWAVIATARKPAEATALTALGAAHPGKLTVLSLDMNDEAALDAFPGALQGRTLDIALVNAGVAGPAHRTADKCTAEEIGVLMFTNAIAPTRLARHLAPLVKAKTGVVAFTSSVMGSVALNPGGHELYRASKAALNSLSRGLWTELKGRGLTLLTLHPGWVRTDMGGSSAAVSVEDSARGMVEVMTAQAGKHQHLFLDYTGKPIEW